MEKFRISLKKEWNMPHLYKQIEGWCTYTSLYDEVVEKFPDGLFVEIGCWFGQSAVYLLEKIREVNGKAVVHFVDHWQGGQDAPYEIGRVKEFGGSDVVYDEFCNNISLVPEVYTTINRKDSADAAKDYDDRFFDFIFIDAGHEGFECYDDMVAWFPKLKRDGIMAGHDVDSQCVSQSIDRFSSEYNIVVTRIGSPVQCWRFTNDNQNV